MQILSFVTSILFAAAIVSAAPSQPEQPVVPSPVSQSSPIVGNSPISSQGVDAVQPAAVVIEGPQHPSIVHHVHQHQPGYYSPSVVLNQPDAVKPQIPPAPVRSVEQYGQPESAALPPNYKPFGSWGLYIGGNPADGYYTNYYKALTNSVDKQASVEPVVKPAAAQPSSVPLLRQAIPSSSPYVGGDFYSFAYSPSDLNSALPVQGAPQHHQHSPTVGQFYGAPATSQASPVEPSSQFVSGLTPYADFYATKKIGQVAQKEVHAPSKGHQQRTYYYPYMSPVQMAAPVSVAQVAKPQQIVAYSVPVGSQIVGSQPGVEGAFDPYGIHAFTRYAVKPTVVSQTDSSYYYSYPASQPVTSTSYKQQQHVYSVPMTGSVYSPFYGFYGYPVNQLHYSTQGVIVPVQGEQTHHHSSPVQPSEPTLDKVEGAVDQLKPQK